MSNRISGAQAEGGQVPCPSQAVAELLLDSVGLTLEATLVTPQHCPSPCPAHGICLMKATYVLPHSFARASACWAPSSWTPSREFQPQPPWRDSLPACCLLHSITWPLALMATLGPSLLRFSLRTPICPQFGRE